MFVKLKPRTSVTGETRTSVSIVESFNVGNGKSKQRTEKTLGVLEDQPDQVAFLAAAEKEAECLTIAKDSSISFEISAKDNHNDSQLNKDYIYGHKPLDKVLSVLGIKEIVEQYQKSLDKKMEYNMWDIIEFHVLERILYPDSKRAAHQHIKNYYGKNYNFTLCDTYRAFEYIPEIYPELKKAMSINIGTYFPRNEDFIYYDGTNYFTQIDFEDLAEDALRKRGVSKEHRLDPIVGFAFFLDCNGLPLDAEVYPGNVHESSMLIEGVKRVKKANNMQRVITVADKGLNTNQNIFHLRNHGDGFVFSQVLRGKKGKNYLPYIEDSTGWSFKRDENGEVYYKEKEIQRELEYRYKDDNDEWKTDKMIVKALIYWDLNDYEMARHKRDEKIAKAQKAIKRKIVDLSRDAREYTKKVVVNSDTQQRINDAEVKYEIDYDKKEREEKLDGYFCIITSEINLDNQKLRWVYRNLLQVEATFRISKTDLSFRPIYHYKKENIISHFIICHIAIVVIRFLQYQLKLSGVDLSVERLQRLLRKMTLKEIEKGKILLNQIGGSLKYQEKSEENKDEEIDSNILTREDEIRYDAIRVFNALNLKFLDKIGVKVEVFNKHFKELGNIKLGNRT